MQNYIQGVLRSCALRDTHTYHVGTGLTYEPVGGTDADDAALPYTNVHYDIMGEVSLASRMMAR